MPGARGRPLVRVGRREPHFQLEQCVGAARQLEFVAQHSDVGGDQLWLVHRRMISGWVFERVREGRRIGGGSAAAEDGSATTQRVSPIER